MPRIRRVRLTRLAGALLLAIAAMSLAWQSPELQSLRNRGKALFEEQDFGGAVVTFERASRDAGAGAQDYINLAASQYRDGDDAAALVTLDDFAAPLAGHAGDPFLRGLIARRQGDIETARAAFEAARALDPTDPAIRFHTGAAYAQLGRRDEASAEFQVVMDMGFDVGVQHYVSSLYQYMQLLLRQGRRQEAEPYIARYTESNARLTQAARAPGALDLSRWSAITVPASSVRPAAPDSARQVSLEETGAAIALRGEGSIAVADLNLDGRQDWVQSGPAGTVWLSTAAGHEAIALATPNGVVGIGDYDRDGRPDLYVAAAEGDRLFRNRTAEEGGAAAPFAPVAATGLPAGGTPSSVQWVDYDHDGDLDIVVTHGSSGSAAAARLVRNLGGGVFGDGTELAGFGTPRADIGTVSADFDRDFDVDLLFWGDDGTTLYSNQRGGLFDEVTVAVGARVATAIADAVAEDFNNDGRIDLALATGDGIEMRVNLAEGTFLRVPADTLDGVDAAALAAADFNNDGYIDLVAEVGGRLLFFANAGDFRFVAFEPLAGGTALAGGPGVPRSLTAADIDGNGGVDVVVGDGVELRRFEQPSPVANWLGLALTGVKNNLQGVGASIEVKVGGSYQLRPLRGSPLHFGVGDADSVEVVRIRWPNGIVQNLLDAAAGEVHAVTELERLEGSCPFLYAWDGEKFGFVNEVLGASPLGMLLAEGVYHVPDGDEYVFVPGERLQARDGYYELRITEELRETAYIDAVRVVALDHPDTFAVLPDEGFGGQPRPDLRLHLYDELLPVRARDQQGREWSDALAAVDGEWALAFEPDIYDGLATEHAITLDLPEAARESGAVQLYLTGWVYWSMGSVNLAVDQNPATAFTPVTLEVPDGRGGWRAAIEDIGLPIAKNTTLIVDLSDVIERSDPRVRLRTTMRLYWDAASYTVGGMFEGGVEATGDWQQEHRVPRPGAIELRAGDGSVAPLRVEVIAPQGAELRPRGFSAMSRSAQGYEVFDYQNVVADAPWEQHRGFYTRFGEVGELLQAADDRYVVVATGDEIAVRFAALERPLPEGWRRDYLVYLSGWVKDTDINTKYGDRVGPLPFQDMSAYPYPASESYPNDEAHRTFLERYLIRPARPINAPLSGGR